MQRSDLSSVLSPLPLSSSLLDYNVSINNEGCIISKLSDLPINFLFRKHDGEWIALEVHKNQIMNFMNVYEINNPKTLREFIENDQRKRSLRAHITTDQNNPTSLFIEVASAFEVIPEKTTNNEMIIKTLSLLENMKNSLRNNFNTDVDKIFSEMANKLTEIKVEISEMSQSEVCVVELKSQDDDFALDNNNLLSGVMLDSQPLDLNSNFPMSQPISNFMLSNLPSVMSEQNMFSIPNQNFEHYYSLNPSDQDVNSINILSPVMTEELQSYPNNNILASKQKRRNHDDIPAPDYSLYSNSNNLNVVKIEAPVDQENIVERLFKYNEKEINSRRYYKTCLECKRTSKFKDYFPCCNNFMCDSCIKTNYSYLVELLGRELPTKITNECFFCANNFYYCSFCLVIDLKENLSECEISMCFSLFHVNCYQCAKILGVGKISEIPYRIKDAFYEKFSTVFLKRYNNLDVNDEVTENTLKKINRVTLHKISNMSNFVIKLYKVNSLNFFRIFNSVFIEEVINSRSTLFPSNEYNQNSNHLFCQAHTCFNCFEKIDPLSYVIEVADWTAICCTANHLLCYRGANENVKFTLEKYGQSKSSKSSSHFPLLHLRFYREFYILIKKAMQDLIIVVSKEKINFKKQSRKNVFEIISHRDIHTKLQPILNNNNVIEIKKILVDGNERYPNSNIFTVSKRNPQPLDYEKLTPYELIQHKEKLKKILISSIVSKTKPPSFLIKSKYMNDTSKCNCMKNAIISFDPKKENSYIKFSLFNSNTKFKKFLIDNKIDMCDLTCTNKVNRIECNKLNCYATEALCRNRYKARKDNNDNFSIVKTPMKILFGLMSHKSIDRGQFIMEITGEIINKENYSSKMTKGGGRYWYTRSYLTDMAHRDKLYLYSYRRGNYARYINHSCYPNCTIQLWQGDSIVKNVNKKTKLFQNTINKRFLIFAIEKISSDEEITIDYRGLVNNHDSYQGSLNNFNCRCSKECVADIGLNLKAEIKNDILTYTSHFNDIFLNDKFKNPVEIIKINYNSYDSLVIKYSALLLPNNILLIKSNIIRQALELNIGNMSNKLYYDIFKNLNSFLGSPRCAHCRDKIRDSPYFCYTCWRTFHFNCTSNPNFREDHTCFKCSAIVTNRTIRVNKRGLSEESKILENGSNEAVEIREECHKDDKQYEFIVYKVSCKGVCCLYSVFYEYLYDYESHCKKLIKKFIMKRSELMENSKYLNAADDYKCQSQSLFYSLMDHLGVKVI